MVTINYRNLPYNFVNSYITDDYHVAVAFDKTEAYDKYFYHYLEGVKLDNKCYVDTIDEDDEVILMLKIPDHFKGDLDMFKLGSYSKFSQRYKDIVKSMFGDKRIKDSSDVTEFDIIYPEDSKRKQIAEKLGVDVKLIQEVFQKPTMERELFKTLEVLLSSEYNNKQDV